MTIPANIRNIATIELIDKNKPGSNIVIKFTCPVHLTSNIVIGLGLMAVGILMFSWTPSSSNGTLNTFFLSVLPGSLVAALGMSIAYIPVLTAAVIEYTKNLRFYPFQSFLALKYALIHITINNHVS